MLWNNIGGNMNLFEYKDLINDKPMHIATVRRDNNPNLSVASDVRVIDNDKIIISVNEMINTQNNIENNPNVVLTVFDKDWDGLRMFGKAKFYFDGKYYDFCQNTFFANNETTPFGATKPKGAMVIEITKVEEFK